MTTPATRAMNTDPGYRLLTFGERVHQKAFGCGSHNFSWPLRTTLANRNFRYPAGFNSHQTCNVCGSQRFFDSLRWVPGPFFIQTNIHPPKYRQGVE